MEETMNADSPGRRSGGGLAALKHRNFRLFWTGQCFSLVGSWMQNMALSWLTLELTGSALLLGLMWACQFGPTLVFSLVAGVVADRLPKRKLVMLTQSLLMTLSLALGLLTLHGAVRFWQLLTLALLVGVVNAFDMPARQSFMIELVGREDLMNAISLNSAIFNGARIVGPSLAGLVIARLDLAFCFLINSASFVAVLTGLFMMRLKSFATPLVVPERDLAGEIKGGLSYILKTPGVLYPLTLLGFLSALAMNFQVLVPVFAREVMHFDAQGFGLMMAAVGAGALTGATVLTILSRFGPRLMFVYAGATGICLFQVALGVTRGYAPVLLSLALLGWSMITFTASVNSSIQVRVPDQLRGRVMSVYFLLFVGVTPFGSLFSGTVAKYLGAQAAFLICGSAGLLVILVVLWRSGKAGSG